MQINSSHTRSSFSYLIQKCLVQRYRCKTSTLGCLKAWMSAEDPEIHEEISRKRVQNREHQNPIITEMIWHPMHPMASFLPNIFEKVIVHIIGLKAVFEPSWHKC